MKITKLYEEIVSTEYIRYHETRISMLSSLKHLRHQMALVETMICNQSRKKKQLEKYSDEHTWIVGSNVDLQQRQTAGHPKLQENHSLQHRKTHELGPCKNRITGIL